MYLRQIGLFLEIYIRLMQYKVAHAAIGKKMFWYSSSDLKSREAFASRYRRIVITLLNG